MSSTIAARGPQRLRSLRAGGLFVVAVLIALAAVAWVVSDLRMAGMDAGPGTDLGTVGFFIATWIVMMAAMMFPSIAPMVAVHWDVQARRRAQGKDVATGASLLFVTGYLVLWGAAGLLAYGAFNAARALDGGLLAWQRGGRPFAAALLLAAALYEFVPLKRACLSRCRSPLAFLIGSWRDGRGGALAMGLAHGAWCLGCCWLLMIGLFALGVMSITWMLVISALIAAEKLLPWQGAGRIGVAAVLVALAIGVAAAPADVPALTIPGSPAAMHR